MQSLGRLGYVFVVFALSGCVFIGAPSAAAADGADLWLYRFEGFRAARVRLSGVQRPDRLLRHRNHKYRLGRRDQVLLSVNDQNRSFRQDPARTGPFLQAVAEALRQGPVGPAWESLIAFEPCPVPLKEISVEVALWHGELTLTAAADRGVARRKPTRRASERA